MSDSSIKDLRGQILTLGKVTPGVIIKTDKFGDSKHVEQNIVEIGIDDLMSLITSYTEQRAKKLVESTFETLWMMYARYADERDSIGESSSFGSFLRHEKATKYLEAKLKETS